MRNPFRKREPTAGFHANQLVGGIASPNQLKATESSEELDLEEGDGVAHGLGEDAAADLANIVQRVASLSPDEGRRLVSFWKTIDEAARVRAHAEAQAAARDSGLGPFLNRVQDELAAQVYQGFTGSSIVGEGGPGIPPIQSLGPFRLLSEAVTWPVVDAVAAVVLSDWLSDAAYDALYVPWERAMDEFVPPTDDQTGAGDDEAQPSTI